MVRRATLRVGGYVFLLPEQVGGLVEYPFYASVTALSETRATVQSLSMEEPFSGTISLAEIANAPVSKVEATRLRHRELLRQAVWTESAGQFWHGQITGFEGRLARLQLVDRVVLAEPTTLSQVAPVVALLLSHSQLPTATTRDELVEMQTTILARILDGTTGSPASNAIPAILEGLVLSATMPPGDIICRWIYPRTGENCDFRLQHAVNFAFVVDGNQPCPPTLRMSIGHHFAWTRFIACGQCQKHNPHLR
ncbi:hypothetical protein PHMEG_00038033 [Phytophthora megakarya]|uniref:Uncharacterized protein n=1 Tax=Phytophthora megakarya TaxID=4795 RepID=A0A225UII7_9STRA|nr:hypothetical protein PHMEG_00038033 [Phytophthora megakarya]